MVSFNTIPANLRVPLFYAEMDNSKAGTFTATYRTLLIGQITNPLYPDPNKAVLISSLAQAKSKFGPGSQLAQMVDAYLKNNVSVEFYALPIADPSAGAAASGSISVSGDATAAGTISLYIYNKLVQIDVADGDEAASVATAIAAAINADDDLPVKATAEETTVTITAKHKGTIGNDIIMALNLGGDANGEETPAGLSLALTEFSNGAGNVELDEAIANLGDEQFDFVVSGWTIKSALDQLSAYMNDKTGNWSYMKQKYGHVWAAHRATLAELQTFGSGYNDQHLSVMGITGTHSPIWEVAAAMAGAAATSIAADPARPLQTLTLEGIAAPEIADRFTVTERETLLRNGISTYNVNAGKVQIDRVITTYQTNAYGQADNSYLSVETLYTSAYILRYLRNIITSKYGRHKLANDGTRFADGQAIVTPNVIRAELITAYTALEYDGLVEDVEAFKKNLIVERNPNDRNRIDVLFTPDYVNQLNIFALVNQFRL